MLSLNMPKVTHKGICKHDRFIIWGFSGIVTEFPIFFKKGILNVSHEANVASMIESYKFPSLFIIFKSITIFHANLPGTIHNVCESKALI